jgi:hypothetical protein
MTEDPVRDGSNWFAYVNNDPVNYVDPFGESPQVIGAILGFGFSVVSEVGGRMASGQSFTQAVSNTINDPAALANIAVSTATGALTSGVSSLLTAGAKQAGKAAVTTVAVNTVGGAISGAANDVIGNAVTDQPQNAMQTVTAAATNAAIAFVSSGLTQGIIAHNTMTFVTTFSNSYGVNAGTTLTQPAWASVAGIIGENVLPASLDIASAAISSGKSVQGGGKSH